MFHPITESFREVHVRRYRTHSGYLVRVALYIGDEKFMGLDATSNLEYLLHVRYMYPYYRVEKHDDDNVPQ